MKNKVKITKRLMYILLVFLFSINSFAAIVSDNDGSAFVTKAEFDALKKSFNQQVDDYNKSIDGKIDGSIATYLAGIKLSTVVDLDNKYEQLQSAWHVKLKTGVTKPNAEEYTFSIDSDLIADTTGFIKDDAQYWEPLNELWWTNSKTLNNNWNCGYNWTKAIRADTKEPDFVDKNSAFPLFNMRYNYCNVSGNEAKFGCTAFWLHGPSYAGNIRLVKASAASVPCIITNSTWLYYMTHNQEYTSPYNIDSGSYYSGSYWPDFGQKGWTAAPLTYALKDVTEINGSDKKDNNMELSSYHCTVTSKNCKNQNKWCISTQKDIEYWDVPGVGRTKTMYWSLSTTYNQTGQGVPGFDKVYFGNSVNTSVSDRPSYDKSKYDYQSSPSKSIIQIHGSMYRNIKFSDLKKNTTNGYCDPDLYSVNANMDNNLKGVIATKDYNKEGTINISGNASGACTIEFYKSETGEIVRDALTEKVTVTCTSAGPFNTSLNTGTTEGNIWVFVTPASSDVKLSGLVFTKVLKQ